MIVPMKKVSLLVRESEKKQALRALRRLGLVHLEVSAGQSETIAALEARTATLTSALAELEAVAESAEADVETAVALAERVGALVEERSELDEARRLLAAELDRIASWGDLDPAAFAELRESGVTLTLHEMPLSSYKRLGDEVLTVAIERSRGSIRFFAVGSEEEQSAELRASRFRLPERSTAALRGELAALDERRAALTAELADLARYRASLQAAIDAIAREVRFEGYATGMAVESLTAGGHAVEVAYLQGYLPADDTDALRALARESAWGLLVEDPTPDDNAPTALHNNRLVSLIYPLTDFLGTVPGYFEYDISAWFLGFILIFFGIIFGDGGYGLLICAIAGALILKARHDKKAIPAAYPLILLLGGATVLWGLLTCTWFGISPELLPTWLGKLSVPVISNVYADKIWYPFWTEGAAGLTTSQNLQIVCFALALLQLSVAHVMGMVRNRKSLKALGDLGAVLELLGIFYVVLSLVVNGEVFGLGLVIGGVPIGTVAIALVGVGFAVNFIFANYEGSIGQSILTSLKNIVSVLLGVVNIFSDIVSYIRLWAVGLAGAAISATVNELASPMLGNFLFIVFAIVILVFGHGLNMILNVLSVIVHGVRLNTLEFSSHLDMSWGGHKYEPFRE